MNNKKHMFGFLLIGLIFFIVGIAIIFIPDSKIKESLNCDTEGRCSYTTQNIHNEVVTSDNFILNKVFEVRKDIVKKSDYRIYYDSRIGSNYKNYNKHSRRGHKDEKISTLTYYDVYIDEGNNNIRCVEITTYKVFNKFKKYYEDRKKNIIPANSELSVSNINISFIFMSILISLVGLISIIVFFKTGSTKTQKPY